MSNANPFEGAVSRLAAHSDAIGRLAQDRGGFAAVMAAFESKDPDAFRWVLDRLELLPHCELICEWVLIKLGVLRCIEVCGPVREKVKTPDLQQFARAIVKLASNEKLLRRVVDAVSRGDAEDYRAALAELKLNDFCYLLCHWVYLIIYRRVCEIVCFPQPVFLPDPADEIRAAAKVMAGVIANEKAFDAIGKAAVALDCAGLQTVISDTGFTSGCEIICWLICVWRCAWVCREWCEIYTPVRTGVYAIEEARNFALAARQLAGQPRALGDLVSAVQSRDAKAYGEIITRFDLGPYCLQVCAWVCSVTCTEFCICVCPNPALHPWFTTVGYFDIYADINAAGYANKSLLGAGGPNFAFFAQLQLGGWCPIYSPTVAGAAMQYRFLYATATTTLAAAITASTTSITVASSAGVPPTPFNVSLCSANESGETMTVTAISGTTWTVVRGQVGTTAAAAGVGAALWTNPTPITNSSPVEAGTRIINWPANVAGLASTPVSTFQTVIIQSAGPPDPIPPATGAPWVGPAPHYIAPDANGWIAVDPAVIGGGFNPLLGFDTTLVVAGGAPLPGAIGTPGGVPAGSAVPAANQGAGTDLSIIFEATRVGVTTVDYSNSLCRIHINNWSEVNNLWFLEFGTNCCAPIDATLSVEFTVDHEEMAAGAWSLDVSSCSPSAPGNITPTVSGPGVTVSPRGGWGTIVEDTSKWTNCSYTVTLTTRPGLTTGLLNRSAIPNPLTFCICDH